MKKVIILFISVFMCCFVMGQSVKQLISQGDYLFSQKEYAKAINEYSKAIKLDSLNAELYFKRGNVSAKKHNNKDALKDYSKAVLLNPYFSEGYYNRGVIKYKLGDHDGGNLDILKAKQLASEEPSQNETPFEFKRIIDIQNTNKDEIYSKVKAWIANTYDITKTKIIEDDKTLPVYKIKLNPTAISNLTRIGFVIPYILEIGIKDNKVKIEFLDMHCYENGRRLLDPKNDLGILRNQSPVPGYITQNKWEAIKKDIELQFNRILISFESIKHSKDDDGF